MTLTEALQDELFPQYLENNTEQLRNRPKTATIEVKGEKKEYRMKRTPYSGIIDRGRMKPDYIAIEYKRIIEHRSKLPRSEREAIVNLVVKTAQDVATYYAVKEAKEKAEAERSRVSESDATGKENAHAEEENAADAKKSVNNETEEAV